jgi:hypothetical protein
VDSGSSLQNPIDLTVESQPTSPCPLPSYEDVLDLTISRSNSDSSVIDLTLD